MSKPLKSLLIVLASVGGLAACSGDVPDTHPDKLVTKRTALFKEFARTLEPMGLVARDRKDYNPREFNISAQELDTLASQPWAYFTPDGNYPPSKTKPEAWSKPAEFKLAQETFQTKVHQLLKAAQEGDLEALRPIVNEVQKSCKSCHDDFRNAR